MSDIYYDNELSREEKSCLGMINSCYIYGSDFLGSRYSEPYKQQLGVAKVMGLYYKQIKYLDANCRIIKNVYTDSDGLTYHSLVMKGQ